MDRLSRRIAATVLTAFGLATLAGCDVGLRNGLAGFGAAGIEGLDDLLIPQGRINGDLVRAPEVFSASDLASWDGRRTARGIWVAHPDADPGPPKSVRLFNTENGAEIDGILYRTGGAQGSGAQGDGVTGGGAGITLSSDAAQALRLRPDIPARINLFGLRPKDTVSPRQRATVASRAEVELASHIGRMDGDRLAQMVAASMRGMGYATIFEEALVPGPLPGIRAYPRPDSGLDVPAIRVVTRPASASQMTAREVAAVQARLTGSGDLGLIVSLAGFTETATGAVRRDGPHVQLVDLPGLLSIWQTYYDRLSGPDQALLPLTPVYFLATR